MSQEKTFPPSTWAMWQEQVARELGGADASSLVTGTPEGLRILPVYETPSLSAPAPVEAPSHAPEMGRPTRVCPIIEGLPVAETRERIREALEGGATSLWFHRIGFVDLEEFDQILVAVDPAGVEIVVRPTLPAHAVSAFWIAWILRRHPAPSDVRLHFGLDPLGRLARTGLFDLERSERDTIALAERVNEQFPRATALAVSTVPYHNAGATVAEELAAALATGTAYLRWLTAAGFDLDDAAAQLFFRFPLDTDQFLGIAKLRAFRSCWFRILEVSGYPGPVGPRIHTVDSDRMLTVYDPWVNMLRTTLSTFAAIVGGSDLHTPLPWDTRLGTDDARARRIARNTGTILLDESRLAHVVDPASGSSYVETLTEELADAAWSIFQTLEVEGMAAELLSGRFRARIAESWSSRESEIRRRRRPITGVSEYANLGEFRPRADEEGNLRATQEHNARRRAARTARGSRIQITLPPAPNQTLEEAIVLAGEMATVDEIIEAWPIDRSGEIEAFPVRHDGDPFEQIRSRAEIWATTRPGGRGPRVFLANLGPPHRHAARAGFARNAFAAGGISSAHGRGTADLSPDEAAIQIAGQFEESGAAVACLCGSDEDYATHGASAAGALRSAGARWILRAGKQNAALAADTSIDDWIYLGSDLPASLGKALQHADREARP